MSVNPGFIGVSARSQEHQDTSKRYQEESLITSFVFIYLILDRLSLCSSGWSRTSYAELASNPETPLPQLSSAVTKGGTATASPTVHL